MIKIGFASRVGVAALAAVCVVAVTAPAASAEPVASDLVCVFGGVTGNLNPAVGTTPEEDGVFTFSGNGLTTCVAVDHDTGAIVTGPFALSINADGGYSNLVAGTGDVSGTACVFVPGVDPTGEIGNNADSSCPAPPGAPANEAALTDYFQLPKCGTIASSQVAFGIDFVGTVGQLGGGVCGPRVSATQNYETGQNSSDSYNLLGAVQILSTAPPPVATFNVTGGFVAETV